jgi:hypothetical protein
VAGRSCFLRPFAADDCLGRLQRAHLIKEQVLRREVWNRREQLANVPRTKTQLFEDPRLIVWACVRHHWQLDKSRTLKIPRHRLPPELEEAAAQYGILWWVDREYGCLSSEPLT